MLRGGRFQTRTNFVNYMLKLLTYIHIYIYIYIYIFFFFFFFFYWSSSLNYTHFVTYSKSCPSFYRIVELLSPKDRILFSRCTLAGFREKNYETGIIKDIPPACFHDVFLFHSCQYFAWIGITWSRLSFIWPFFLIDNCRFVVVTLKYMRHHIFKAWVNCNKNKCF